MGVVKSNGKEKAAINFQKIKVNAGVANSHDIYCFTSTPSFRRHVGARIFIKKFWPF